MPPPVICGAIVLTEIIKVLHIYVMYSKKIYGQVANNLVSSYINAWDSENYSFLRH